MAFNSPSRLPRLTLNDGGLAVSSSSIQNGAPVLLENVPVELDPVLENVLNRQVIRQGGVSSIKVGDNLVEYSDDFQLCVHEMMC